MEKTRAALFLDPYGMEVEFKTLKVIANTKAIDTWYLFPTNSIKRQMHKEWEATPEYKIKSIDNLFGNKEWRSAFYEEGIQGDMFKKEKKSYRRYQDIAELERFIKTRFNEIFPYVSDAIPIISKKSGHQLFSLYCCVANDSPKAKDAVKKIVEYIEKKFKQL